MEGKNKEIWDAEVKGILVKTQSGKNILIQMSEEVQRVLFKE